MKVLIISLSALTILFALLTPFTSLFPILAILLAIVSIYLIRKQPNKKSYNMFILVIGCILAILSLSYYGLPTLGDVEMEGINEN